MNLPKVLTSLLSAQEKFDSEAFAENFLNDAIVYDEGKTYTGKEEIKQWNEMTNAKYNTTYEPLEIRTEGEKITLVARISGTFPGSPAIINYNFEIKNGKIASLSI